MATTTMVVVKKVIEMISLNKMIRLYKSICWVDPNGETVKLTDDEVITKYNELLDDNHALCRDNAELREQIEQLKTANGKAVKALRRSAAALRKSVEEDKVLTAEEILEACKEFPDLYEKAKKLAKVVEQFPNSIDAVGARMSLRALYGVAMSHKNLNPEAI